MSSARPWMTWRRWVAAFCLLSLLLGCRPRPVAPRLDDLPVYINKEGGFRLIKPEGWHIRARSAIPPGKLDTERNVVEYRRQSGHRAGSLEVSVIDIPSSTTIEAYLETRPTGPIAWRKVGAPKQIILDGIPALRFAENARLSLKEQVSRETVVVRRGDRLFLFTGMFPAGDIRMREQIRATIASIVWEK